MKAIIIAGPNGAGKTTFAGEFLPKEAGCPRFVNADLIAAGLSPFAPEAAAIKAGRLMIGEILASVAHRESFSFETTLSGLNYLRHIGEWRALGYHVSLFIFELAHGGDGHRARRGAGTPGRARCPGSDNPSAFRIGPAKLRRSVS